MKSKTIRIYADSSVFGGAFDDNFEWASNRFFELVKAGRFRLVVSTIVGDEISRAPRNVRELLSDFAAADEFIRVSKPASDLQAAISATT